MSYMTLVKKAAKTAPITNAKLICLSILMIATSSGLSGCATLSKPPPLTPQQCQQLDWQKVGFNDGAAGRSGAYFGRYLDGTVLSECQSILPIAPNRIQWEQGRQEGLKAFCTALNAYKYGRDGLSWPNVCPIGQKDIDISAIEAAYAEGRADYIQQLNLYRLSRPYYGPSLYYGAPYYGGPFYAPLYGPYTPYLWRQPWP